MSTYISIKKTRGIDYLYAVESYYTDDGKRTQKIVKSFGRLDEAKLKDPDIVEKLKQKYENSARVSRSKLIEKISESIESDKLPLDEFNNINLQLNYGVLALRPIWNEWLKLSYKISNIQDKIRIKCDISKIAMFLASLKICDPGSYFCAYRSQHKYLYNPLEDVSLDDIYNTLDFLGNNRDVLMHYLNKVISERNGRKLTMVFYDCSNVYFETPYDDKQKFFRRLLKQLRKEVCKDLKDCNLKQLEEMTHDSELINTALEQLKNLADEDTCFRMRGLSKEHRYDLPLVSIALVIDDQGIPVDFQIFPGNTSEYHTMPVLIKEMKEKYGITDTIVVADRGLNSIANINMLIDHDLGFIVAQKVSNLKSKYEEIMLNNEGYKSWNMKEQKTEQSDNETNLSDADVIFKRVPYIKEGIIDHKDPSSAQTKKKRVKIDCEIMFTFSKKRQKRDLAQLENDIALAQKAVEQKLDMTPHCSSGWKSLVSVKKEEEESQSALNENINNSTSKGMAKTKVSRNELYKAVSLKENIIAQRRKIAGYAAVIYKKTANCNENINDSELMNSYHQLVKIEECFRIMKSNFSIRPVHVRKKINIYGHITICVIALIMTRLLEIELSKKGTPLSINQIQAALQSSVTAVGSGKNDGFFIKNSQVENVITVDDWKNCEVSKDKDILLKRCLDNQKQSFSDIDKILEAVGLKAIKNVNSSFDMCNSLKLKGTYKSLIGSFLSKVQSS